MRKKPMIIAAILALTLAMATGCNSKQAAESPNTTLPLENKTEDQSNLPVAEDQSGTDTTPPNANNETDTSPKATPDDNTPNVLPANVDENTTIIGGKVRSVTQDSFVISRTLIEDSDDGASYVTIPGEGSPEEELVTIHCTGTTAFELWTIQGGGTGIETDEATFSDIQIGGGLEVEGYFDGEEFIAEKVIIEIFK